MAWPRGAEPFEDLTGPYYFREDGDGRICAALMIEPRHLNGGGFLHGGAIMTLIDFALFAIAYKSLALTRAVTLTCNTEFIGAGRPGVLAEAHGEVVKETRSVVFIQGRVVQKGEVIATFSATLKKSGPRS
jgi:uncharacterized protein (TIGR00369 family)